MIVEQLDNWDSTSRHRLALVSRTLYANLYATPGRPPRMTRADWVQFNNEFERHAPHCPISLPCPICATLLPPTSFIDNHARKTVRGSRCCLACGIRTGTYQKVSFKLGGILSFACGGCRQASRCRWKTAAWKMSFGGIANVTNRHRASHETFLQLL